MNDTELDTLEFAEESEVYGETYAESPFNEVEEMELASELLEITDEGELNQFLGNLIKKAGRAVGTFVRTPVGRALGGMLKGAARKALPIAGRAIGTYFGGPAGGAIGGQLASKAGGLFGLELEGLSMEDQEFEVAKQFVRLAGAATKNAVFAPPTNDPQIAAKTAVATAAQKFAPGLLRGTASGTTTFPTRRGRSGRWIRRGRNIILLNV
jgi:hypothetical protein